MYPTNSQISSNKQISHYANSIINWLLWNNILLNSKTTSEFPFFNNQ